MAMTSICAIPAQCKKCGSLFDLSYDLKEASDNRAVMELLQTTLSHKMSLCWECRRKK